MRPIPIQTSFIDSFIADWEDGTYRWQHQGNDRSYIPEYLVYRNHPGMPDPDGVALVYEGCPELLLYNYRYFRDLTIPLTTDPKELHSNGYLELLPHMYIFYRNLRKSDDPKDDLLKLWVTDENEVKTKCKYDVQNMQKARDKLLGERAQLKGSKKGGTALERSGRGNGNAQGDRCFTYSQSIEMQRGIGHPPGNMSQAHRKNDETLIQIKELEGVRL